jgi:hypothetical protein
MNYGNKKKPKPRKGGKGNYIEYKLTPVQRVALRKHSEHHSLHHINLMEDMMIQGMSFSKAHKMALSIAGQ